MAAKVRLLAEVNPDVTFELVDSSAPYTLGNFHSALHTLWEGAILTVLVVFLFLRDIRATIIAAIALPLSIVPAFWAMDSWLLAQFGEPARHHHRHRHPGR